ncbi:thiamine pyrophosphate-binding protein [Acidocella aromatica]|uniref:Acetolactate synthase-1/2/3 large subunit n=1 Tax=Acidocella aromatica TaxID=1303579 RepID=A0A840VMY2_9PROT|nr:thiamine pyrophosphate-binding protein [Acidocella aromatica]MBB5372951.1 acetolactate synthase-1/2/3 large subunit [Acidocella aromatica]
MRVADYIAALVAAHGVKHFFTVTGGGAMHLNDAFSRNKDLHGVCLHHEQACAMAAEAYCRLSGRLALLNVTTGPGGINALNGVHGAWTDSIGMLVISGQVKQETMATSYDLPLRQLGDQEADIVAMVKGITKYAVVLRKKEDVRYVVEKALHLAQTGRPGPVWIDVPMDIQGAQIDPDMLHGFTPEPEAAVPDVSEVTAILRNAKRPVIMPGTGVRISGAYADFLKLVERTGFPVATAFNAHDVLPDDHPAYVGRPGTVGDRAGNFAVQNADVVLILGCRLNIRQISYNWENFAPNAVKIMVDIDPAELAKPTLKIEKPVLADLKTFIPALVRELGNFTPSETQRGYLAWCQKRRSRYPVVQPEYIDDSRGINPYIFADRLFDEAGETDVVVTANATACVTTFQAAKLKAGQRMFSNSGSASMGYDLPAAIGAAYAAPERRIICLSGDGSFMMNMQELQSIVAQKLNIKIFLLNNAGYSSIKQTQSAFFPDNMFGCDESNGVTFPDFCAVAAAFRLPVHRVSTHAELPAVLAEVLAAPGPQFCEIMLDPAQTFAPKLSSRKLEDGRMVSSPLHDMAPFLSREELAENMWSEA